MIRRLFWLTLGAVLGVTGYRRLTMLMRSWSPAARAGQLSDFVADVRDGMAVYRERHPRPEGSALRTASAAGPAASQGTGTRFRNDDDTKDGS